MSFDLNAAAVAAAIAAAGLSLLTKLIERIVLSRVRGSRIATNSFRTANASQDPLEAAVERVRDAAAALSRQKTIARANRWMSGFLVVGQYIVGGLLASSFVQQSLSKETVGGLGVLVLLSSLIYQHFRPDIQLRGASGRVLRLTSLIRSSQDDLVAMKAVSSGAPTIDAFRKRISDALTDIEVSELQDLTVRTTQPVDTTKA